MLDRQLKYIQARLAITRYIAEHDLHAGDRLPPTRTLFSLFDHSAASIRRALTDLEESGIIECRHGSGSYLKQQIRHNPFQWHILYLSFYRKGIPPRHSFMPESLRSFLASFGIGLIVRSVHEVDLEIINAAEHSLGIMVFGWCSDSILQELQKLNRPVIVVGNSQFSLPLPNVTLDLELGARRLTETMLQDGLKDLLLIRGDDEYLPGRQAARGYSEAMSNAGLPVQIIMTTTEKSYDCIISEYMPSHPGIQGILMEHTTFFDFASWAWRTGYQNHPAIGFLNDIREVGNFRLGRNFMGLHFEDMILKGAEIMMRQIIDGEPMQSLTLEPSILGSEEVSKAPSLPDA